MLVMVVFFIAFRWIHLSTPLIRLFLLVLILLLMPTLNFLPVWFALSLLRFRLPSRLPMMFILFQAEDGIRIHCVTGVQTCALPIYPPIGCGGQKQLVWRESLADFQSGIRRICNLSHYHHVSLLTNRLGQRRITLRFLCLSEPDIEYHQWTMSSSQPIQQLSVQPPVPVLAALLFQMAESGIIH